MVSRRCCLSPGFLGEQSATVSAREAWIDRRLENDHRAWSEPRPNQRAGTRERRKVGPVLRIDRCWHGYDKEARVLERVGVVGEAQFRLTEGSLTDLTSRILPLSQGSNPVLRDVEAHNGFEGFC